MLFDLASRCSRKVWFRPDGPMKNLLVRSERFVGSVYDSLNVNGIILKLQHRKWLRSMRRREGNYDAVFDSRLLSQNLLNIFRVNVHPGCCDNYILFSSFEVEVTC